MNPADFLIKIKDELQNSKKSDYTIRNYLEANNKLLEFLKKEPEQVTCEDVQSYLNQSLNNHASSRITLVLSALKYAYLRVLQKDITSQIARPKKIRKIQAILTGQEAEQLFKSTVNKKSRLMISLIHGCGLKVCELVNLRVDDLDFDELGGKIRLGLGKKERKLILPSFLLEDLNKQIEYQKIKNQDFLFTGPKGKLSTRNIQKIIASSALAAGIGKDISPHSLRCSFVRHKLEEGEDIKKIQVILGHAHLSTTQDYTRISNGELNKKGP